MSKYLIVNFYDEKTRDGKAIVDLVPSSWVRPTEGDVTIGQCSFPPYPYLNLKVMVQRLNSPGLTWKEYPVKIMGSSGTYERGIEKVTRAQEKLSVSTDDEGSQTRMLKSKVSFDDVPTFPGSDCETSSFRNVEKQSAKRALSFVPHPDTNLHDNPSTPDGICVALSDSEVSTMADTPPKGKRRAAEYCSDSELDSPRKRPYKPSKEMNSQSLFAKQLTTLQVGKGSSSAPPKFILQKNTGTLSSVAKGRPLIEKTRPRDSVNSSDVPNQLLCSKEPVANQDFQVEQSGIKDMEKRLIEEIQKVKRSNNHDFRKLRTLIYELRASMESLREVKTDDPKPFKKLSEFDKELSLPCKTLQDFEEFDKKLTGEEFTNFESVLESLWIPLGTDGNVTKSLLAIFERFISKDVALKYSALGKGKLKKLHFSATRFYKALENTVMSVERAMTVKKRQQGVSKILAGAGDWDGGRLEREEKRTNKKAEGDANDTVIAGENGERLKNQPSLPEVL